VKDVMLTELLVAAKSVAIKGIFACLCVMPYVGHKAVGVRKSCWSCSDCHKKPIGMQKALFGMTVLTTWLQSDT